MGRSGFSFTKPLQFLAHATFLGLHRVCLSVHLCPTAALPREKSLGPVPALDCGDGFSANQRGVSSIALVGSPSESGGWPLPTSHSVRKRAAVLAGNAPVVVV